MGQKVDVDLYIFEFIVIVKQVCDYLDVFFVLIEILFVGFGLEKGVGVWIWVFLYGVDNMEVKEVSDVLLQISIEDIYKGFEIFVQII